MTLPVDSGIRFNNTSLYVALAYKHYAEFQSAEETLGTLASTTPISEVQEHALAIIRAHVPPYHHGLIVIAFSAFAVESHIYDYAARRLGDGFAEDFLDKLETKAKWVVVTQMVTGKPFPIGDDAYRLLRSLIKERNDLVHHKSKKIDLAKLIADADAGGLPLRSRYDRFRANVHDAINALQALTRIAQLLDPADPFFSTALSKPSTSDT